MKTCKKCLLEKDITEYRKRKSLPISTCRQCERDYTKNWRKNNPSAVKSYNKYYREKNPDYEKTRPIEVKKKKLFNDWVRVNKNIEEYRAKRRSRRDHLKEYKYTVSRRKRIKESTIYKFELPEIKEYYRNCPEGMIVDHIIPLFNNVVCGLNVLGNLQYLTRRENSFKGNSFDGTIHNNGWRNGLAYSLTKVGAAGESALTIYRLPS